MGHSHLLYLCRGLIELQSLNGVAPRPSLAARFPVGVAFGRQMYHPVSAEKKRRHIKHETQVTEMLLWRKELPKKCNVTHYIMSSLKNKRWKSSFFCPNLSISEYFLHLTWILSMIFSKDGGDRGFYSTIFPGKICMSWTWRDQKFSNIGQNKSIPAWMWTNFRV